MEFSIGEYDYKTTSGFDGFENLHVARKMSPALPLLDPLFDEKNSKRDNTVLIVMALSRIPDDDCNFIIQKCLSKVSRFEKEANKYAPVLSRSGDLMYQDITLKQMLDISVQVIEENLGDFFRTALGALTPRAPEEPSN